MLNSRNYAVLTAMLSAAGLLPMSAMANISFTEGGERLINTLHTHLYSPSSGLSSSDEIKLAAVCFINDTSACSGEAFGNTENNGGNGGSGGAPDYDLNDAERCRKEGYALTSCAAGETPEGFCIYNSNYFARCVCPSGYKTCEPPYYGVGQACGNKYASCEEDTERACKEIDPEFTDTCQTGWKVDPNNACEYDSTFGKCCNLCEGYDYTTIPEGYIADGAACVDCNGTSKYKIKINPCDGFQDCGVMGGDTGAKTCMSGSQIKYDNCKPCPNLGTLSSCPSPFTCTYEECSNRYYKSGCQSGYDWNASAQTCTPQCASSYKYTCTDATQTGGSGTACNGLYEACTCSSGYVWNGSSCAIRNACMKGSQLGYILNSDMTVTSTTQSGKTPIGVVVCSYSGGGGQAMALKSVGKYKWGPSSEDILGLPSLSDVGAPKDTDSCGNTEKILAEGDKSEYPAAWTAYEYSTEGTNAGDWCLPAAGIFTSYKNNQSAINKGFSRAGGTQFTNSTYDSTYAWSSSEYSRRNGNFYSAWNSYFYYENGLDWYGKGYSFEVRPVIGFCDAGYEYDKSTDTCKCGSAFQYTCKGTGYSGGSGTACGGKYQSCKCKSGYEWNGTACENPYKYACNKQCESPNGTAYNGLYKSCKCSCGWLCGDELITLEPNKDYYESEGCTYSVTYPWNAAVGRCDVLDDHSCMHSTWGCDY